MRHQHIRTIRPSPQENNTAVVYQSVKTMLNNILSSGYFYFIKIQENLRRNQIFTDITNANTFLFNATDDLTTPL